MPTLPPETYTVESDATYDSNNNETYVPITEEIRTSAQGTLRSEEHLTTTSRAMHLSGGTAYYGNIEWPTRFPDVAYTEDGNYNVRLQNEYVSSDITVKGPWEELTGVSKVMCAWHLEAAMHVYVEDTFTFNITNVNTTDEWYEISEKIPHIFQRDKTITVKNPADSSSVDRTVESAEYTGSATRIHVIDNLTDDTIDDDGGTIDVTGWNHYRRATPSEQGLYTVEGGSFTSNFIFDGDRYPSGTVKAVDVEPGSSFISEPQTVVFSRVNRPFEVTSNGFGLPKSERIEALFPARLAEEEGLISYDFYAATDRSIYTVKPDPENDTAQVSTVSNEFGIGLSFLSNPVYATVPQGAIMMDSQGVLRVLSGRQEQRLFPEGSVPWATIHDIAYHPKWNEVAIATDEGVWFYDWDRRGIFRQIDAFEAKGLVYDTPNDELLGWDHPTEWKRFDGAGSALEPEVVTQEIESGGREVELIWIKTDYDKSGYSNTDKTTYAELWHTVRSSDVMDFTDRPDMIQGDPVTTNTESSGATSIDVTTDSDDSVDLKSGEKIRFTDHSDSYEVASDVSIGNSSSGTIQLSSGLNQQVSSGTSIRPDKYRGVFKVPAQERIRPPFAGSGHQIKVSNFDTLRDIQIRVQARVDYE